MHYQNPITLAKKKYQSVVAVFIRKFKAFWDQFEQYSTLFFQIWYNKFL